MGAMGRYIDHSLNDEQRDRIISATQWGVGFFEEGKWDGGCRCLCGHAENWLGHGDPGLWRGEPTPYTFRNNVPVYVLFPEAVSRFGLRRVVRAVKLRAAAASGTSPAEIADMVQADPSLATP